MEFFAVIGGADYEGAHLDTLQLFVDQAAAEAYAKELQKEIGVDYVEVKELSL